MVTLTGAAAGTALVAGCGGGGGDGGDGGDGGSSAWEDVSEIELGAQAAGWEGQAPSPIEGENNPTLVLYEGQQYTVTWENLDGTEHNFELRNSDDEVVGDHETELMGTEGETQTYEFEATSEMAEYVCNPHSASMRGTIQIESSE
jgi:hypothetical protein